MPARKVGRIFQDQISRWTSPATGLADIRVKLYVISPQIIPFDISDLPIFPGRLVTTTNGASRDDSGVADDAKFLVVLPSAVVDFSISEVWMVGQVDSWIY